MDAARSFLRNPPEASARHVVQDRPVTTYARSDHSISVNLLDVKFKHVPLASGHLRVDSVKTAEGWCFSRRRLLLPGKLSMPLLSSSFSDWAAGASVVPPETVGPWKASGGVRCHFVTTSCRFHATNMLLPPRLFHLQPSGIHGWMSGFSTRAQKTLALNATRQRRGMIASALPRGKGQKSESVVQKEIGVVMAQLAKLNPQSQQTLGSVLKKYAKKLGPECVLGTLWELIRRGDWQRATEAFDTIRNQMWYERDPIIYAQLITIAGKAGQVKHAEELFDAMDAHRCERITPVYTAMVDVYGRNLLLRNAVALFEEAKVTPGCEPDEATYCAVMRALCRSNLVEEAEALFAEMPSNGCLYNEVSYNIMIDGYGRCGQIEMMQRRFLEMCDAGIIPDVYTYNSLVRNFGRWGLIDSMEACFESMQLNGCAPDQFTMTALIDSYGKWGQLEKMARTMKHMLRSKYRVGLVSFNAAIDAYGKAGKLREMEDWFKQLRFVGLKPNHVTFCSMLYAYGQAKLAGQVSRVLGQMQDFEVKPDVAIYNAVIDAYGNLHAFDQVDRVWVEMKLDGIQPDAATYSALVGAYAKGGFLMKMEESFREMKAVGLKVTVKTYNAMMAAYAKVGTSEKVTRLWNQLLSSGERPDTDSYVSLILVHSRVGAFDSMDEAFSRMRAAKCRMSEEAFATIIEGYAAAVKISHMELQLKYMEEAGFQPSLLTLNLVIQAYGRAGQPRKAEAVLEDSLDRGLLPDPGTFAAVLAAQGKVHLVEAVSEDLLEVENAKGIPSSAKACAALLLILSRCQDWQDALPILGWMGTIDEGAFRALCRLLQQGYVNSGVNSTPTSELTPSSELVAGLSSRLTSISKNSGSPISDHGVMTAGELGCNPSIHAQVHRSPQLVNAYQFKPPSVSPGRSDTDPYGSESSSVASDWTASPNGRQGSGYTRGPHAGQPYITDSWHTDSNDSRLGSSSRTYSTEMLYRARSTVIWQDALGVLNRLHRKSLTPRHWRPFYSALIAALWSFGLWGRARHALGEARMRGVMPDGTVLEGLEWSLDVHLLCAPVSVVALLKWLEDCHLALARSSHSGVVPPQRVVVVLSKKGKGGKKENVGGDDSESVGSDLAYQDSATVRKLLEDMGAPFSARGSSRDRLEAEGDKFCNWIMAARGPAIGHLFDAEEPGPGWRARAHRQRTPLPVGT